MDGKGFGVGGNNNQFYQLAQFQMNHPQTHSQHHPQVHPHPHQHSSSPVSASNHPHHQPSATTRSRTGSNQNHDGDLDSYPNPSSEPTSTATAAVDAGAAKGKQRARPRGSVASIASNSTADNNDNEPNNPPQTKGKGKGKGKETKGAKKGAAKRTGPSEDAAGGGGGAPKKRRRVVVACDVCRRKKIACKPQPGTNPADPTSAPCSNCHDYDYKCTFSAEPDRSRGKFEILEARFDALLRAFKEADPAKATEFEEGQGWTVTPAPMVKKEDESSKNQENSNSGGEISSNSSNHPGIDSSSGTPNSGLAISMSNHNGNHSIMNSNSVSYQPSLNAFPAPHSQYRSFANNKPSFAGSLFASPSNTPNPQLQLPPLSRTHPNHHHNSIPHSGPAPMLPDLEDGRPRYFGSSSTLSLFSTVNSRPPSPTGGDRHRLSSFNSSRNQSSWMMDNNRRLTGHSSELPLSSSRIGSRAQSRSSSDEEDSDGSGKEDADHANSRGKTEENGKRRGSSTFNHNGLKKTFESRNQQQRSGGTAAETSRKVGDGSSFSRMVLPRPRPLYPNNSKEWVAYLRRKNLTAVGRDDVVNDEWFNRYQLPSSDILFPLLTLFFTHLHPLMPILHPPSLLRDISLNRPSHDTAFRGLIFCIIAIAARFSDDPRVRTDPNDRDTAGDEYAAGSRLYHQVHAASLTNVQVLILTSTFLHSSVGSGTSWLLLGMAIRGLLDIGLHQEKADADLPPFEREIRRRTFWGAFILDCVFAVNMGRPMALRLSDCHVRLPLSVSDETLMRAEGGGPIPRETTSEPTVMDGFIHLIRLNVLVQDIVDALYNQKWLHQKMPLEADWEEMDHSDDCGTKKPEYKDMVELSKRLDEWENGIPAHVSNIHSSPYRLQAGILSCGRHDIRMYIYKPFLSDVHLRRTLHPQCVPHARECVRTVNDLYQSGDAASLAFIFQQAFMSTATFLITVWHTAEDPEVLAQDDHIIESTLRMFNALEDRFSSPIFRKAHRMLRNIAARVLKSMESREQQERIIDLIKASDPHLLTISSIHRSGLQTPAPGQSNLLIPNHSPGAASPSTALAAYSQWVGASPVGTPGGSNVMNSFKSNRRGSGAGVAGAGGVGEFQHPFNPNAQHPPHLGVATPSNAALFNNVLENELEDLSASQGTFAGLGVAGGGDGLGGGSTQMEDLGWTEYFSKFLSEIGSVSHQPAGVVDDAGAASNHPIGSNPNQTHESHASPPPNGTQTPHSSFPNHSPLLNQVPNSLSNTSHVLSHYSNSHTRTVSGANESSSRPRTRPPTPSFVRSRPQTPNNSLPLGLTPPPPHH